MEIIIGSIIGIIGTVVGAVITAIIIWKTSKRQSFDKFKLAAIDKRLAAYQETYGLMFEIDFLLLFAENSLEEELKKSFKILHEIIKNTSLYLNSNLREALRNVYISIFNYLLDTSDSSKKNKLITHIQEAKIILEKEANLPSFGSEEKLLLEKVNSSEKEKKNDSKSKE